MISLFSAPQLPPPYSSLYSFFVSSIFVMSISFLYIRFYFIRDKWALQLMASGSAGEDLGFKSWPDDGVMSLKGVFTTYFLLVSLLPITVTRCGLIIKIIMVSIYIALVHIFVLKARWHSVKCVLLVWHVCR